MPTRAHCKFVTLSRCFCILVAALVRPGTSGEEQTTQHVLEPEIFNAKSYFEIYTLTSQFDDRTFVQVQMAITNIGPFEKNAACKILVFHGSDIPWKANRHFGPGKWSYCAAPNPTLSIGTCRISSMRDKTLCTAFLDGVLAVITFERSPPAIKPPNTDFTYERKKTVLKRETTNFFEGTMLVPWSKVHAVLSLPGKPIRKCSGYGMLEHSRSVGFPADLSRGWVTFTGYTDSSRFCASVRLPPQKETPAIGWIWIGENAAPTPFTCLTVMQKPSHSAKEQTSGCIVTACDGSFKINAGRKLLQYSIIDELGPVLGNMIRILLRNPITDYYEAQVIPADGTGQVPGILELMTIK